MRQASVLVFTATAVAACGIDVIGIGSSGDVTPNVDGGLGKSSSSSSGSSGTVDGDVPETDGGTDAPYVPPFDAGAAEVMMDGVQGLTSITIAGNRLVVGRADLETLTIDVGNKMTGTITNIKKARALFAVGEDVFYVNQVDTNTANVGHSKADGSNNGVNHGNEPSARDVFVEGMVLFGSYQDHVVSYTSDDLMNIQDRSDKLGTPMGVVATPDDVYWADDSRGAVFKDSRQIIAGPSKVTDGLDHPSTLAAVGTAVFVATSTTITRVTPSVVPWATGLSKPMALTHDGDTLYWLDASAGLLKRQSTTGASPAVETIGTFEPFAEFRPKLIDFKAGYVYWGSPSEGRVYRRKE